MRPHPSHHAHLRAALPLLSASALALLLLLAVPSLVMTLPRDVNTPVHTILEIVSVVVSVMVFAIGWHTLHVEHRGNVALLCCTFAGVGLLDLVHMLVFEGMPPFVGPSGGGRAIPFFLAARLLAALALLAIAWLPWDRPVSTRGRWLLLAAVLGGAAAIATAGLAWPETRLWFMVPGKGLTPLKVVIEWLLVAMNLAAAVAFWLRMRHPQPWPVVLLFSATLLMALSELALTLYTNTADLFNVLGHVYKVAAYLLVYRALFVEMLQKPYVSLQQAQQEVVEGERRWRTLFENSLDGVLLTAPDGSVLAVNPAACRLFGMSEEELVARGRQAVVDADDPRLAQLLAERERTGRVFGELRMRRSDGSFFEAEVSSQLYRHRDGEAAASILVRDVSQRKAQEREILRLNADLEERVTQRTAQLLEANRDLERFAYAVAHDLRSPLGGIGGFAGALDNELADAGLAGTRIRHYAERISANTARMEAMIGALLNLAQVARSPLQLRDVDLSALADDVVQQLREREPGRDVDVRVQPGLRVHADPALAMSLMENLLGNAWKFTGATHDARIEFGVEPGAAPGEPVVFHVRDNGAGFDMANSSRLFGPFQRLHTVAEFPGHGVGLATVKRIVDRHGGRIWAESSPGRGACFRFTLPGERLQQQDGADLATAG